jgi:FkbM family methyltransferase
MMVYLRIIVFCVFACTQNLFGVFNDRRYEGVNPDWQVAEGIFARLDIIASFLPNNPTVFEVGAKDGEDSVKLANIWKSGKIISFEANPNQFVKYEEKARNYSNMFGYNLAVNTYNGFATFYLCWGDHGKDPVFEGASSLLQPAEGMEIHYMGPEITVPCVILDDWCRDNQISAIDFMWLDLEGFELQLLKSSPEILKTVKVIYTETNFFKFRKGTTAFGSLKYFLEKNGFKLIAHWYNEGLQGDAIFVRETGSS